MNFNLQYTSFVSFLNFYLSMGVIFQSDNLYSGSLKYFEDDVMIKAKDTLRSGEFLKWEPEKFALTIIMEIRKKYRLTPWT
jgi:hypothetical protein